MVSKYCFIDIYRFAYFELFFADEHVEAGWISANIETIFKNMKSIDFRMIFLYGAVSIKAPKKNKEPALEKAGLCCIIEV